MHFVACVFTLFFHAIMHCFICEFCFIALLCFSVVSMFAVSMFLSKKFNFWSTIFCFPLFSYFFFNSFSIFFLKFFSNHFEFLCRILSLWLFDVFCCWKQIFGANPYGLWLAASGARRLRGFSSSSPALPVTNHQTFVVRYLLSSSKGCTKADGLRDLISLVFAD